MEKGLSMEGWIKLYRKLLEWEWWDDHNVTRLFITLLLSANHYDNKWRGILVKRGQLITSIANLGKITGLSTKEIRTSLSKLKSTNEVASKGASHYTIITICNYDNYQETESTEGQTKGKQKGKVGANKGQTKGKQRATNKNDKNDKNDKNERSKNVPPTIEMISAYCSERKNNINPQRFFDFYQAKGWMIGKDKMKDWQAAVRTWEQRQGTAAETGEDPIQRERRIIKEYRESQKLNKSA